MRGANSVVWWLAVALSSQMWLSARLPGQSLPTQQPGRQQPGQPATSGTPASPQPGQLPQAPSPAVGASNQQIPGAVVPSVEFDGNQWPVTDEPAPQSGIEYWQPRAPSATALPPHGAAPSGESVATARQPDGGKRHQPVAARGAAVDSPLPRALAAVGSADALHAMGGVEVWWRITVYGPQGEVLGQRVIEHIADLTVANRDRLEDTTAGVVFGRMGASVFAQRRGIQWLTGQAEATAWLELLGTHLRMPWAFADRRRFYETDAQEVSRRGEMFWHLAVRSVHERSSIGPSIEDAAVDEFELLIPFEPALPSELVHRFASSGQRRRVRLEDWRAVGEGRASVQMPHRRLYVDSAGRPTTELQILRLIPAQRLTDDTFRSR